MLPFIERNFIIGGKFQKSHTSCCNCPTVVAVKLILQAFVNNECNVLLGVKIVLGDAFGEVTTCDKIWLQALICLNPYDFLAKTRGR